MDRLLSMEVFVTAVDSGSFTAAAELFELSPQMVGKHVRDLEARLGARLLTRTTRRQSLTEIGQQYYERCKFILAEIRAAETSAETMRAAPRGNLKISASVTFGSLRLASAVADFLNAHPDVSVQLSLNNRIVDIVEEGFDAAVRIGALADSGLVARRLAPYQMILCASPAYLKKAGVPRSPADLARHQCLDFTYRNTRGGWIFTHNDMSDPARTGRRFQANNGQALRMAALAGLGIIMQPQMLLADDLRDGRLAPILKRHWPAPWPMHLVYPRDRQAVPKLTAFVDFMLRRFG